MGKTIAISSHILPELADLCSTVGILEGGELLFTAPSAGYPPGGMGPGCRFAWPTSSTWPPR